MFGNRLIRLGGAVCLVLVLLGAHVPARAASKTTCPEKVIDVQTVTGTYLGWFETEEGLNTIGIQVPGETEPVYIGASEEEARKFFGNGTGQRVSVTWQVEQMWIDETRECLRLEILKEGHPLDAAEQGSAVKVIPGQYKYMSTHEDASGELQLSAPDPSGKFAVTIETISPQLHTCGFSGFCTLKDDMLICRNAPEYDDAENPDAYVGIKVLQSGLEIVHGSYGWCGAKGSMVGIYMLK